MEIWKDILGYKDIYQVSNTGKVMSLRNNKILKLSLCGRNRSKVGYYQVCLSLNSKLKYCMIHRLVAKAFIENPENKREVNHINGDSLNNYVDNLEWSTSKENHKHAYDTGLINDAGENNTRSVLTNQQAREIRALSGKIYQKEIGKIYGISQTHVSQIITNRIYKNA